jgi:hypothetical protein
MNASDDFLFDLDYENAPELTAREIEILHHLLSADLPDAELLREQAIGARLLHTCSCGCATVALVTNPDTPAARDLPIAAVRSSAADPALPELVLRIERGRLASIEIDGARTLHETFPPAEEFDAPVAVFAR